MYYWTVQSKKVLEIIDRDGIYKPDIEKSTYLEKFKPTLKTEFDMYTNNLSLYQFMKDCAFTINNYPLKGLIYCFCKVENNYISDFKSQNDFYSYLVNKKEVIKSLWDNLSNSNSVLLQLEFNEKFWNPLFIDINDYQYLMPPVITMPPYQEDDFDKIKINLLQGVCKPIFNSGIIQAHLPYITKGMIKNIVPLYRFDNTTDK